DTPTPLLTEPPTSTPAPATPTPTPIPQVVAADPINVRSGPSTDYPVISALQTGESAAITGTNAKQSWWQIALTDGSTGWVFSQIIPTAGDTTRIAKVMDIPGPPSTPTPSLPPTATPAPTPAVDYVVQSIRLWGPVENGGYFDGPSLHCGEKRQLRGIVLDAAGQPLNGVTLLGIYSHEELVTGSKGTGMAEWILGDGDGLRVLRDVDGSSVVSESAKGMVTDPARISDAQFIAAGFCADAAGCQALRDTNACHGHYSWDVTFQRTH
ncbi:MAG: SH3 domain-containing protein, partial [Chloroflexi bacterium]|nr:SH3 domain-containing protein [Chloroflexota bacterium]